jgi:hypothetical protein
MGTEKRKENTRYGASLKEGETVDLLANSYTRSPASFFTHLYRCGQFFLKLTANFPANSLGRLGQTSPGLLLGTLQLQLAFAVHGKNCLTLKRSFYTNVC